MQKILSVVPIAKEIKQSDNNLHNSSLMQPIKVNFLITLSLCLGHMFTEFQFVLVKISETAIQKFALFVGPPCT